MALDGNRDFNGNVKPSSVEQGSYERLMGSIRTVNMPLNYQIKIDYVSGTNPIYVGVAGAGFATSSGTDNDSSKPNWMIRKLTWDVNNNPTAIQIGWGKWDNRATTVTYS